MAGYNLVDSVCSRCGNFGGHSSLCTNNPNKAQQTTDQKLKPHELEENGLAYDDGKPQLQLLPFDAIIGIGQVLTFGAGKYTPRNWEQGTKFGRRFASCLRHLFKWWMGEDIDPESKLPHLDHALTQLCMIRHYTSKRGFEKYDDRPKYETRTDPGPATSTGTVRHGGRNYVIKAEQ